MENIKDFDGYLRRMRNGMDDKLWWVKHSNHDFIVDYGCADGTLLKHIREIHPNYTLIGVDINPDMLKVAQSTVPDAVFMTVDEFFTCGMDFSEAILILSSVIHEIYSYDKEPDRTIFKLLNMGFDAIAIRDMFVSDNLEKEMVDYNLYKKVAETTGMHMIADFSKYYGYPYFKKQFIHYLLKYRYIDNWDREVAENYLPIDYEKFIHFVSAFYEVKYQNHYILPFIKEQIQKDFGFELEDATHAKILLKKYDKGIVIPTE